MSAKETLAEYFWARVPQALPRDACWEWNGSRHLRGYGIANHPGFHGLAHRLSLLLSGTLTNGDAVVMHSCDNPPCVNPAHLKAATQRENMDDMRRKGRWKATIYRGGQHWSRNKPERLARGSANGSAKLSESQVLEIMHSVKSGKTQLSVAQDNGVSKTTVGMIMRGDIWRHITGIGEAIVR